MRKRLKRLSQKPTETVDQLLDRMGNNFIGLWNYRGYKQPRKWAVTYQVNGFYYDTLPQKTSLSALRRAIGTLKRMKTLPKSKRRIDCAICRKIN